jgi:SAM-dependent methyltransferase
MTPPESARLPDVIPALAQRFREHATSIGLNPDDRWVGGYAEYEMTHLLPALKAYGIDPNGKQVLEFGCNVGASSVALQTQGAKVTGVDIEKGIVALAELNSRQHGFNNSTFDCVPDTRKLPYSNDQFDLVVCNSVLEYVPHTIIADVQRELNRVTKPGGIIFVTGTASRLAPREVHSGRLLINFLPRSFDRFFGKSDGFQRGISPFQIRNGFGSQFTNLDAQDGGASFLRARASSSSTRKTGLKVFVAIARIIGVGPGLILPSISCILKKANNS